MSCLRRYILTKQKTLLGRGAGSYGLRKVFWAATCYLGYCVLSWILSLLLTNYVNNYSQPLWASVLWRLDWSGVYMYPDKLSFSSLILYLSPVGDCSSLSHSQLIGRYPAYQTAPQSATWIQRRVVRCYLDPTPARGYPPSAQSLNPSTSLV